MVYDAISNQGKKCNILFLFVFLLLQFTFAWFRKEENSIQFACFSSSISAHPSCSKWNIRIREKVNFDIAYDMYKCLYWWALRLRACTCLFYFMIHLTYTRDFILSHFDKSSLWPSKIGIVRSQLFVHSQWMHFDREKKYQTVQIAVFGMINFRISATVFIGLNFLLRHHNTLLIIIQLSK